MANDYLKKFAPVATHLSSPTSATKSARNELMQRSKKHYYSITSLTSRLALRPGLPH